MKERAVTENYILLGNLREVLNILKYVLNSLYPDFTHYYIINRMLLAVKQHLAKAAVNYISKPLKNSKDRQIHRAATFPSVTNRLLCVLATSDNSNSRVLAICLYMFVTTLSPAESKIQTPGPKSGVKRYLVQ